MSWWMDSIWTYLWQRWEPGLTLHLNNPGKEMIREMRRRWRWRVQASRRRSRCSKIGEHNNESTEHYQPFFQPRIYFHTFLWIANIHNILSHVGLSLIINKYFYRYKCRLNKEFFFYICSCWPLNIILLTLSLLLASLWRAVASSSSPSSSS